jgi:hypothetical protein
MSVRRILGVLAASFVIANFAVADPFTLTLTNDTYDPTPDGTPTPWGDNNRDIYQAINRLAGTAYAANQDVDGRFVQPDYVWRQLDGSVAAIGLTAGNSNSLGVYTDLGVGSVKTSLIGPHSGFTWLGDGTQANPYPGAVIPVATGADFAWYMNTSGVNYYSEPGLNGDLYDHMVTYGLPDLAGKTIYIDKGTGADPYTFTSDAFLIAWEDLSGLGDEDFDDYMVVVDKAAPIPAPSVGMGLMSMSAMGIAAFVWRRRKRAV